VTLALAAKAEGLPVKVGLEVDYYAGQMDQVSELLRQYPFDVLIGSVHWLGTWQFDDIDNPVQMAEWTARDVDASWAAYARALRRTGRDGGRGRFGSPGPHQGGRLLPGSLDDHWDVMAAGALATGISLECSSAGWVKPVGEQYPALGLLDRLVAGGATFTTASDAHRQERVGERASDLADLLEARGVNELAS
jgi:histidinol-phosphatase (PHP family)